MVYSSVHLEIEVSLFVEMEMFVVVADSVVGQGIDFSVSLMKMLVAVLLIMCS